MSNEPRRKRRLPRKPPRHPRLGPNAREMIAVTVCMMMQACRAMTDGDIDAMLTTAIRQASHGDDGLKVFNVEGMGPTECLSPAGMLVMTTRSLGIDLTEPHQAETVEEYARRCLDHYRDCDLS